MPLTPEQLREQNEKKALEEMRILWLKHNRHIHWFDLGEGIQRDPKEDQEISLLRGEAKIEPRDPMTPGFKRREDGFFKRDVYYNGQDEVSLFGFPTAKAIENAQQLLASQGMMTCTYDVTSVRRYHVEALIARYLDALGKRVEWGTGNIVDNPSGKREVPLKLLLLGPNIQQYVAMCTMGYFGRVVGGTRWAFFLTGRAKLLLQLSKMCEAEFNEAKRVVLGEKSGLGRDEIENLARATNRLNDTDTHPPAPVTPADRANYINNQFAAGDTPDMKLDKIETKLNEISERQRMLEEEKAILTREISEARQMIASADTRPDQLDELLTRLERTEDSRMDLMDALEREEKDLRYHLAMWRGELNTPQYAGNVKQRTHLDKIDELAGKPPVEAAVLKQEYLDVETDATAKKAAPPPAPAPAPGP